jgi:hypothetical protein
VSRSIDDRAFVQAQYETEDNLRARKSAYENAEGDDPREFPFEALADAAPCRVLEVGGGEGELAERINDELGAEVIGVGQFAASALASLARVGPLDQPLRVRRHSTVFVAEKAS